MQSHVPSCCGKCGSINLLDERPFHDGVSCLQCGWVSYELEDQPYLELQPKEGRIHISMMKKRVEA